MARLEELQSAVIDIFSARWASRTGQAVPDPEDLRLGNDVVEFDRATVLYADLHGSTNMVDSEPWWRSAEIYKTFLHCAASIIRDEGGAITSYDGDRVMGIWIGKRQTTPAAIAGLVTPLFAAVAMSLSSMIVVGNSLRLMRSAR